MRITSAICLVLSLILAEAACPRAHAQAALLLEDADGISSVLNPTGHDALYFSRICAAGLTKLRRCRPDESGVVIARYKGIGGYDWLAVPLIPYLYSVENASQVPGRVDAAIVRRLRVDYHDRRLLGLGHGVPRGGRVQRGWNQLVGASYEREIHAFRFETTPAQDDAFIAWMNARANRSHFSIFFRNCANFADGVLNFYFPHTFERHILPDAGIVTPRQVAYELVRYGKRHPGLRLNVLEIPVIPGYRRKGRLPKCVAEALVVNGYVIPIAFLSPIAAGALVADWLAWGRYPLPLKPARALTPETVSVLR